jgi:hypothetical protein
MKRFLKHVGKIKGARALSGRTGFTPRADKENQTVDARHAKRGSNQAAANCIKFPLSISGLLDSCWSLVMQSI